jgi:hypothetical protein
MQVTRKALWSTLFGGLFAFSMMGAVLPQSTVAQATPEMAASDCVAAIGIGAEGDACVNIVHASSDAPAVDVYVDGVVALEGLEFGQVSGWVALPAGDHQVQVTATGEAPETAVIDAELTLDAGVAYEVAAIGVLAEITPQVYVTDLSELEADMARVRVIHTSPDAPAVDVAVAGGDVLVGELEFPKASDAVVVPAGTYDLEVRLSGTMDVALDLPGVEFEAGMTYDVYAIGQLADGSLTVLVIASPTGTGSATPMA